MTVSAVTGIRSIQTATDGDAKNHQHAQAGRVAVPRRPGRARSPGMERAPSCNGALRLPMLLEGWETVDSFGFRTGDVQRPQEGLIPHQPVFALRPRP